MTNTRRAKTEESEPLTTVLIISGLYVVFFVFFKVICSGKIKFPVLMKETPAQHSKLPPLYRVKCQFCGNPNASAYGCSTCGAYSEWSRRGGVCM